MCVLVMLGNFWNAVAANICYLFECEGQHNGPSAKLATRSIRTAPGHLLIQAFVHALSAAKQAASILPCWLVSLVSR